MEATEEACTEKAVADASEWKYEELSESEEDKLFPQDLQLPPCPENSAPTVSLSGSSKKDSGVSSMLDQQIAFRTILQEQQYLLLEQLQRDQERRDKKQAKRTAKLVQEAVKRSLEDAGVAAKNRSEQQPQVLETLQASTAGKTDSPAGTLKPQPSSVSSVSTKISDQYSLSPSTPGCSFECERRRDFERENPMLQTSPSRGNNNRECEADSDQADHGLFFRRSQMGGKESSPQSAVHSFLTTAPQIVSNCKQTHLHGN